MTAAIERAVVPFPASELAQARAIAATMGRPLVEVLEEQSGLDPESFLVRLGATVHRDILPMAQLREMQAAFDILPFKETINRECLLLRDKDAQLTLVVADLSLIHI